MWHSPFPIDGKFIAGPVKGVVCVLMEMDMIHEEHEGGVSPLTELQHEERRVL